MMLTSYSTIKGSAIMTWVITSGGVRIAAPAKNSSSAYFRFFFKNSTETRPSLAIKVNTMGSSNTRPRSGELGRLRLLLAQARRICSEDAEGAKKMVADKGVEGVDVAENAAWMAVGRVVLNLDEFISRE